MDIPVINDIILYINSLPPDTISHAKNLGIGAISTALLLAQRGTIITNRNKDGVAIAPERSLAYQLSIRIPGYAHVSPLIDHALESVTYVFGGGGLFALY